VSSRLKRASANIHVYLCVHVHVCVCVYVSLFVRACVTCRIGNEYSAYCVSAHLYANKELFPVHIDTSLIEVIVFVTFLAQAVFSIDIITLGSNTSISV